MARVVRPQAGCRQILALRCSGAAKRDGWRLLPTSQLLPIPRLTLRSDWAAFADASPLEPRSLKLGSWSVHRSSRDFDHKDRRIIRER
jgi:hypothetical protein